MAGLLDEILNRIDGLDPAGQADLVAMVSQQTAHMKWVPSPGPQTEAYFCEADELFYGGSAGGGKSELLLGLSLNEHCKSLILRREREQVHDLFERVGEILDTEKGRNGQQLRWDIGERTVRFGGCKQEKDKQKYKGRPYDLYGFDEISDFLQSQYEFIITWNRSARPGQRCRIVVTGNPPTTAEGLWVIQRWAAWLDPKHPNPAKDGEIRWYTTTEDGKEHEVDGPGPHRFEHEDGIVEEIRARSRTFIRARLSDNPYLSNTEYGANLDALPAELRAAYRDGRFDMSLEDNPRQVIPTAWVLAAQDRWKATHGKPPPNVPMCAIGVDIAQGGKDETVLACRHDGWYAPMKVRPGKETPDGKSVVAFLVTERRNRALPIIDMGGGYGGDTHARLVEGGIECVAYKGSMDSTARSKCKNFGFNNKRSEAHWKFREALDPDQPGGSPIMLPDDPELVSQLCAMTFDVKRGALGKIEIIVESKEALVKRIGKSPNKSDAVIMAWTDGAKADSHASIWMDKARPPQVRSGRGHTTNQPQVRSGRRH